MCNVEPNLMPPRALAERLNELGVSAQIARVICFGVCPKTKLVAQAFRTGEHVLLMRTGSDHLVILPPRYSWRKALEEHYAA